MRIHRRTRLDEVTLVVGIDIAKKAHVAVLESPDGSFSKALTFKNSRAGFLALAEAVVKAAAKHGTQRVVVGYESTGHYGKPLEEWLATQGYERQLVSALHTKRAKDMLDNSPLKSDAKDAAVIADLLRQGYGKSLVSQEDVYMSLRILGKLRARLVRERTAYLNRLNRTLDVLFPELPGLFSKLSNKTVLALLEVAPTPHHAVGLGVDRIAELLRRHSRGRLGQARAEAIVKAAEQSIGCQVGREARCLELAQLLPRIAALSAEIAGIEGKMGSALKAIPYAKLLQGVPYLGTVTVAVVLGELGDLRKYRNVKQVLKMAGLGLYEKSSGQHTGQRHITKRGRSQLRQALYMAVSRMMGEGRALAPLQARSKGKPFAKVAVAGMRRLLRTLYAMARDHKPFVPLKLIAGPVIGPGETHELGAELAA